MTRNRSSNRDTSRQSAATPAPAMAPAASPVNQAEAYGVRLTPVDVQPGAGFWRVALVRHLTPNENRGKHNIFVDAVDAAGNRVRDPNLRIHWTWEGKRPDEVADPKQLDKPDSEPAGNVDVNSTGTHVTVWLAGDGLPSERVENLHTNHPDEPGPNGENWNSIGHHSFYVRFERAVAATPPEPNPPTPPEPNPPTPPDPTPPTPPEPHPGGGGSIFLPFVSNGGQGEQPAVEETSPPEELRVTASPAASYDEIVLARLWNRVGGVILREAQRLGIDPGVAAVTLLVESSGSGFGDDGRMTVRFENHIFWRFWGEAHPAEFGAVLTFDPAQPWTGHQFRHSPDAPWQPCHQSQGQEWQVFDLARRLDETAALLALSMGMAQVMGFNYRLVGFDDVRAMFQAYATSEANQVRGFFKYVENAHLVGALRAGDYVAFARGYNGSGWADQYATLIRDRLVLWLGLWGNRQVSPLGATAQALGQEWGPAGLPPALAAALPALPTSMAAELRFLVELGVIYEGALARLPADQNLTAADLAAVTAWARQRLAALLR